MNEVINVNIAPILTETIKVCRTETDMLQYTKKNEGSMFWVQ